MSEPQRRTYVGVDIGGTRTRMAIVDDLGRVLADRDDATPAGNFGEDLVTWLDATYHLLLGETDSYPNPEAIGVGVPGILEPARTAVVRAVNLPFIEGLPLQDRLVERTGLKTFLDSDAVSAGWGEFCARDRQQKRFGYLTIGTGVGGTVILGGEIMRHAHNTAGHIGHLICDTDADAPLCSCGTRGCLEAIVSGVALNEAAEKAGFEDGISHVESAFQDGEPSAIDFVNGVARSLSFGLIDLAHLYALDILVAGGGVVQVLPSLVRTAGQIAAESGSTLVSDSMRVELCALGQYAGVVGAALLAAEHVHPR